MVKLLLQDDLKLETGCDYLLSEFCLFFTGNFSLTLQEKSEIELGKKKKEIV